MQLFHVLKYESLLKTCQYSKSETYLVEDVLNQKDLSIDYFQMKENDMSYNRQAAHNIMFAIRLHEEDFNDCQSGHLYRDCANVRRTRALCA